MGVTGGHARYVWRRVPWRLIGGATAVCTPALLVRAATADSSTDLLPFVRLTSVVLAAVSVYGLDDPARDVTEATRRGRTWLRMTAVSATTVAMLAAWLAIVWVSRTAAGTPQQLPTGGLMVELLAMATAGWSIAAVTGNATGLRCNPSRAATTLIVLIALTLTTPRLIHELWVGPGSEWARSHVRWAIIGVSALAIFTWSSRDPARRSLVRHRP